jgi:hypothetical protein
MAYKISMFLLSLSGDFSLDFFHCLIATWFLSVGYLCYKHANGRVRRTARSANSVPARLLDSSQQALLRG